MSKKKDGIGLMDKAYFVGKTELIEWLNRLLQLDLKVLDELSSGAIICQVFDAMLGGKVQMQKVNFSARTEYDMINNYKVLQNALTKFGIKKEIDVNALIKGKDRDKLEFLQWLKAFYVQQTGSDGESGEYDALSRRAVAKGGEALANARIRAGAEVRDRLQNAQKSENERGSMTSGGSDAPITKLHESVSNYGSINRNQPSQSMTYAPTPLVFVGNNGIAMAAVQPQWAPATQAAFLSPAPPFQSNTAITILPSPHMRYERTSYAEGLPRSVPSVQHNGQGDTLDGMLHNTGHLQVPKYRREDGHTSSALQWNPGSEYLNASSSTSYNQALNYQQAYSLKDPISPLLSSNTRSQRDAAHTEFRHPSHPIDIGEYWELEENKIREEIAALDLRLQEVKQESSFGESKNNGLAKYVGPSSLSSIKKFDRSGTGLASIGQRYITG